SFPKDNQQRRVARRNDLHISTDRIAEPPFPKFQTRTVAARVTFLRDFLANAQDMFSHSAVSASPHPSGSAWRTCFQGFKWGVNAGLVAAALTILAFAADEPAPPADALTIDQAVRIALANNRNVKIVSLSLDASKEKLAAEKTRRYPSFNTYIFGSQVLQ